MDTQRRTGMMETAGSAEPSKRRRRAFRIVSWVTALWFIVLASFALVEPVLMWLPESSIGTILGEDPTLPPIAPHRSHYMAIGIVAWILVVGVVVHLRKPRLKVAPMLYVIVAVVGGTVVYGLSGTLGEWLLEEWTMLVPVAAMTALHPSARELFSRPAFDRRMVLVATVGAAPWFAYATANAYRQLSGSGIDPHYTMEHWAVASLMGLLIASCAVIGSTDKSGWRLPAWLAAAAATLFGLHTLAYPGLASGLSTVWGVAAIAWGLAYGVSIVLRTHHHAHVAA